MMIQRISPNTVMKVRSYLYKNIDESEYKNLQEKWDISNFIYPSFTWKLVEHKKNSVIKTKLP